MPYHIIVYRDGVADNQFESMLDTEYGAMREAVDLAGYTEDRVKISIIVCQKRHHTRLAYQPSPGADYMNPCVGLVVDAQGSEFAASAMGGRSSRGAGANMEGEDPMGCIVGSNLNEFYLNSHAAVLGTSKPTKYILVRDEIGFRMSELQLLTFWLTHLYCRCTRSVSIATPGKLNTSNSDKTYFVPLSHSFVHLLFEPHSQTAYYAHWAARRGKILMNAGVDSQDLDKLSNAWIEANMPATMYFI